MRKLFSISFNQANQADSKSTFGQKRAQQLNERLEKAVSERRKLYRAEAVAEDPLRSSYTQKAAQVERKISRLTTEVSKTKK